MHYTASSQCQITVCETVQLLIHNSCTFPIQWVFCFLQLDRYCDVSLDNCLEIYHCINCVDTIIIMGNTSWILLWVILWFEPLHGEVSWCVRDWNSWCFLLTVCFCRNKKYKSISDEIAMTFFASCFCIFFFFLQKFGPWQQWYILSISVLPKCLPAYCMT